MVEQELSNIVDLNYVVVRPAIIYGPGDRTGLSTCTLYILINTSGFVDHMTVVYKALTL